MKTLILLLPLILTGCPSMGYQHMTPEQIKATAGTISCSTVSSLYGTGSVIAVNTDDTRKGLSSKWKTDIKCGDATMTIDAAVSVP